MIIGTEYDQGGCASLSQPVYPTLDDAKRVLELMGWRLWSDREPGTLAVYEAGRYGRRVTMELRQALESNEVLAVQPWGGGGL